MQLVLASGNKGKLREFQTMMGDTHIVPFGEFMEPFEIVEDGDTFAANALIKARAVYRGLTSDDMSARRADLSSAGLPPIYGVPEGGQVLSASTASLRSDRIGFDPTNDKQLSLASRISHVSSLRDKTQNTRPLVTPTNDYIVISDDSGISVPALGGEPGIYSARYAGEGASDKDNLYKLIDTLKSKGIKRTPAYYTAAIAIVSSLGEYVVHGWMHGEVIDEARGDKGFGYDPMFVPYRGLTSDDMSARRADLSSAGLTPLMFDDKTLGELDDEVKSGISHRSKALELAKPIIEMLKSK